MSAAAVEGESPAELHRIATEEAWATPALLEESRKLLDASFDDSDLSTMRMILGDNPVGKRVRARLIDTQTRLQDMDDHGVTMHVLSVTTAGVQIFEPSLGSELAQQLNDQLAEIIRQHPDRFAGLAAVAPQEPQSAAREVERAMTSLGLNGVIINSHTNGEFLDDKKFWPILEAAAANRAPIYLHPRTPSREMVRPYRQFALENAIWGYQADTALHAVRLIVSGAFDQFPELTIVLGHCGEGIPYWLHRLDYMHGRSVGWSGRPALKRRPSEYFRDNFIITTSGQNWDPVLRFCLEVVGVDNIMWAIDYPYQQTSEAVEFMDNAPISDEDRRKIYSENARRVFRLTR